MRNLLLLLLVLLSAHATSAAQIAQMPTDGSLPASLKSSFDGTYAFVMGLGGTAPADEISVDVTFDNGSTRSVNFTWLAAKVIAGEKHYAPVASTVEVTSFQPTAVTRLADSGSTIFVAGWISRSKTCVIEQWDFDLGVVGSTYNPATGGYTITFSPPTVSKTVIFQSSTLAAIEGLAFHPVSSTLYLLEFGSLANVHTLDASASNPVPGVILTASTLAALEGMRDVRLRSHANMPYILAFMTEPNWSENQSDTFVLVYDTDADGVFETGTAHETDVSGLLTIFPNGGWIAVTP